MIKENAHLDIPQDDVVPVGTQVTMRDLAAPAAPKTAPKRQIKIVDGNNRESQPKLTEPAQSKVKVEKIEPLTAEKKNSILKYMSDENLFGKTTPSGTFGLEEKNSAVDGFGIDGAIKTGGTGLGLEAEKPASVGFKTTAEAPVEPPVEPSEAVYETEKKLTNKEAKEAMLTVDEINNQQVKKYKKPPISLLDKPAAANRTNNSLLTEKAEKLEDTLKNFNVDARVVQVTQGPTVTRYEVQPAVGVKVSSIVRLADDIALNLEAKSIRIEAPIPGKASKAAESASLRSVRGMDMYGSNRLKMLSDTTKDFAKSDFRRKRPPFSL